MSHHTIKSDGVPIKTWAPPHEMDSMAIRQLQAVASLPWVAHHVAVMPDVHVGVGATVGSVIAMRGAVAPAAVGVDIGCGMAAVKTSLRATDLPDTLRKLRQTIEENIPVGMRSHEKAAWESLGDDILADGRALMGVIPTLALHDTRFATRAALQVGTLGGGNHFIEVCLDTEDGVWLMLHSGSRGVGNVLAQHHMEIAARLGHNQSLEDRNLAVFIADTPQMDAYRRDLYWAQAYALFNRRVMMVLVRAIIERSWPHVVFEQAISCHHNYLAEEAHFEENLFVTRKGAIRAQAGDMGIIPGSMGTKSFIVRGLGNPQSFNSASHGAGRRMSRGQARKQFTEKDLAHQTAGVECRKDRGVVDEIPAAYKEIDRVMEQQADLVEIVATLKQVLCVKG